MMPYADKETALIWQRAAYVRNRKKRLEEVKDYYHRNRDDKIAYAKYYRKLNVDNIKAKRRERYLANKETVLAKNKQYQEEHSVNIGAKKRARKFNSIPEILRNCRFENERLKNIYKLRDVMTGVTGVQHHVDHMWPLSDGGPHWSGNLQIITATENLAKSSYVCPELKRNIKAAMLAELHGTAEINDTMILLINLK
jgi:5-methylcytosine-specific restriction endonuclease McrA